MNCARIGNIPRILAFFLIMHFNAVGVLSQYGVLDFLYKIWYNI